MQHNVFEYKSILNMQNRIKNFKYAFWYINKWFQNVKPQRAPRGLKWEKDPPYPDVRHKMRLKWDGFSE